MEQETPQPQPIIPLLLALSPVLTGITDYGRDQDGKPLPPHPDEADTHEANNRHYYNLGLEDVRLGGRRILSGYPLDPDPWVSPTMLHYLYPPEYELPESMTVALWFIPGWDGDLLNREAIRRIPRWCTPFNYSVHARTLGAGISRRVEVREYSMAISVQGGNSKFAISPNLYDWIESATKLTSTWAGQPETLGISLLQGSVTQEPKSQAHLIRVKSSLNPPMAEAMGMGVWLTGFGTAKRRGGQSK